MLFCDEGRVGQSVTMPIHRPGAIVIGPEGGFSPAERGRLVLWNNSCDVIRLRILRRYRRWRH